MNDKVMHEAQNYKMSLEFSYFQQPALQRARDLYNKLGLRHNHARIKQEIKRVSENRSKVSNKSKDIRKLDSHKSDKSAFTPHTSTVRTMSSSEKRHEPALVKRCHEELERQYQVSIRLEEQENCLKFEQSQLELEQLAESHKKQLIEIEMKASEVEDSSSEVSEKVAESNSTGVRHTISKVATDKLMIGWTLLVHKHLLTLLAFTLIPNSSEPTTSANLAHAIHTSNSHNHEHKALSDPGI